MVIWVLENKFFFREYNNKYDTRQGRRDVFPRKVGVIARFVINWLVWVWVWAWVWVWEVMRDKIVQRDLRLEGLPPPSVLFLLFAES
jgi:hypothetical protein